jgi:hypothetical protein
MRGKVRIWVIFSIILFVLALACSQCLTDSSKPDFRGVAYANPQTCIKCHQKVTDNFVHTGHYNTSKLISTNQLQADVNAHSNEFIFNDSVKVKVEKQQDGLYQSAYFQNKKTLTQRLDVAFGSGEKAQTYAYWQGNKLFELPLSYFRLIQNWANSPGFPVNRVNYNRAIISRCFECHASYLEKSFVQNGSISVAQEYNRASIIYGIDCQRCHGPAAEHVEYHLKNPEDKKAKFMVSYQALNREQKVNMCAVCHSGNDAELQKSTFGYKPGEKLSDYYYPSFGMSNNSPDVHGSQTQLLEMSKCYQGSAVMTCTTCHHSHTKETGNLLTYSQKCMNCHKTETHNFCKMATTLGTSINNKCIDCHMPAMPSKLITYKAANEKQVTPYYLRTHQIAVYPQKTKQIIAYLNRLAPVAN